MTQKERVLKMLKDAGLEGVRSDRFLAEDVRIPRAAARVGELIAEGHHVTSEREKQFTRYRLVRDLPGFFAGIGADSQREPGVHGLGNPTVSVDSGRGGTGGRGQPVSSYAQAVDPAPGAPARSVPSMFDYDADWEDAA